MLKQISLAVQKATTSFFLNLIPLILFINPRFLLMHAGDSDAEYLEASPSPRIQQYGPCIPGRRTGNYV